MQKKSRMIVFIILAVIAIAIAIMLLSTKSITLTTNNIKVDLKYSNFNFTCEQEKNTEGILKSNNEEIQIKINENLQDYYESFGILKDYRMMAYNGQEKEYNSIQCFYYYDYTENSYIVIAPINEEAYLGIYIVPKEGSNKTAEETFNKKEVQKVLESLKIDA